MDLKSRIKSLSTVASAKLVDAFERADELGGDARDWLEAKIDDSDRAKAVLAKVKKLRKDHDKDVAEETRQRIAEARAAKQAAATEAAPPPSAAEVTAGQGDGLGDPGLAAQIYGRSSCPWSGRVITLFERKKVDYDFIDLDDEDNGVYESPLLAETHQNTVPYVFVRGEFIGGYDAIDELERLGVLDYKLLTPAEREAHDHTMKNVVVAKRENTDERHAGEVEDHSP
jgi:glutaredoxin